MSTMTLEQVRDWHREHAKNIRAGISVGSAIKHDNIADAIDAHLRERESAQAGVSDEVVHEAIEAYVVSDKAAEVPRFGAFKAALEAVAPMLASARVPDDPTEDMLVAARDWSYRKYGKPIGNDAAIGCWQAMLAAATKSETEE